MSAGIRTAKVARSRASHYLKRAEQFNESMHEAHEKGNWESAGLNAVHCGISACDAILVVSEGIRSKSLKHDDAVTLLERYIKGPDVYDAAKYLRWLIGKKNIVAYEERGLTKKEADAAVKNADAFLKWVESRMPPRY
jgi:HEPN domain-containing protein